MGVSNFNEMETTPRPRQGKSNGPMRIQDPSKTVWVGGLLAFDDGVSYDELLTFGKRCPGAVWAEVKGTTGAVGYSSAAEAAMAIRKLNGQRLKGAAIQVDSWTGSSTGGQSGNGKGKSGWTPVYQSSWQKPAYQSSWERPSKAGGKSFGKGKGKRKWGSLRNTSKVIWISGIPEGVEFMQLKEHGEQAGKAIWAEVKKNGVGFIGYETIEEATAAVDVLNGTELGGAIIEVDSWEKKDKE